MPDEEADEIRVMRRGYLAPLVFPIACLGVMLLAGLFFSSWDNGWGWLLGGIGALVVFSLVLAGPPYALFAVWIHWLLRNRRARSHVATAWLSPLLFLPVLFAWHFAPSRVLGDGRFTSADFSFMAVYELSLGYAYVIGVLLIVAIKRRQRQRRTA